MTSEPENATSLKSTRSFPRPLIIAAKVLGGVAFLGATVVGPVIWIGEAAPTTTPPTITPVLGDSEAHLGGTDTLHLRIHNRQGTLQNLYVNLNSQVGYGAQAQEVQVGATRNGGESFLEANHVIAGESQCQVVVNDGSSVLDCRNVPVGNSTRTVVFTPEVLGGVTFQGEAYGKYDTLVDGNFDVHTSDVIENVLS